MGFAASNDEFYSSIRLILVQVSARYQKGMAKSPAFLIITWLPPPSSCCNGPRGGMELQNHPSF